MAFPYGDKEKSQLAVASSFLKDSTVLFYLVIMGVKLYQLFDKFKMVQIRKPLTA